VHRGAGSAIQRTEIMAKPKIVSANEWQQARDELLKAEKGPLGRWTRLPRAAAGFPWSSSTTVMCSHRPLGLRR
jgi:predicted dithiol-disulfide oxidoreductase (DUF899 family)